MTSSVIFSAVQHFCCATQAILMKMIHWSLSVEVFTGVSYFAALVLSCTTPLPEIGFPLLTAFHVCTVWSDDLVAAIVDMLGVSLVRS